MPYKIRKLPNSNRYKVFNSETGKVHSEHATKKNANAQMRLLYSLESGESQYPKEDQSEETAGEGINHKGRKKGSKNKVKKPPKIVSLPSRLQEEDLEAFHPPLTKPIGTYITTWRWVLYREKEKQGITYPLAMKQRALKELYYKLKEKCEEADAKREEEGEEVEPSFTIAWLEANWDKYSKKLPQLWQEQLCGKSGKKPIKVPEQANKISKYFKKPQDEEDEEDEEEDDSEPPPNPPPNVSLTISEKDDEGEQPPLFAIEGEKDPEDIDMPSVTSAPKNIEKAVIKVEEKIQQLREEGQKHGLGVQYNSQSIIGTLIYLHLLEKYSNNCAVITTDTAKIGRYLHGGIAFEGIDLRTDWKTYPEYIVRYLGDTLKGCIERGIELILVPLNVLFINNRGRPKSTGHANVLVIRPLLRIAERFEPHGAEYANSEKTDKIFNKALQHLVEEQLTQYIGKYKFRTPEDICPNSKGFQSFEGQYERLKKEGGGFCMMWSCFLMELCLMNPDYTTKQIIEEAFRITEKDPKALKEVIRGYVVDCEKILDQLLRNVASEEFRFNTKRDTEIISKHKTLLQNYALQVIFNLNSVVKPPLNQPDEPMFEETQLSEETTQNKALKELLTKQTKQRLMTMIDDLGMRFSEASNRKLKAKSKEAYISNVIYWVQQGDITKDGIEQWIGSH